MSLLEAGFASVDAGLVNVDAWFDNVNPGFSVVVVVVVFIAIDAAVDDGVDRSFPRLKDISNPSPLPPITVTSLPGIEDICLTLSPALS